MSVGSGRGIGRMRFREPNRMDLGSLSSILDHHVWCDSGCEQRWSIIC
jgi:hypothetical protein